MKNYKLKDKIQDNIDKQSDLVKGFLAVDEPDSLFLWAMWDLQSKLMQNLKELHKVRGGTGLDVSDRLRGR